MLIFSPLSAYANVLTTPLVDHTITHQVDSVKMQKMVASIEWEDILASLDVHFAYNFPQDLLV